MTRMAIRRRNRSDADTDMKDAEPEEEDALYEEIMGLSTQDILTRKRLLENDSRIMRERVSAVITREGHDGREDQGEHGEDRQQPVCALPICPLELIRLRGPVLPCP